MQERAVCTQMCANSFRKEFEEGWAKVGEGGGCRGRVVLTRGVDTLAQSTQVTVCDRYMPVCQPPPRRLLRDGVLC